MELREEDGDIEGAFEMAKRFLRNRIDFAVLQQASLIARKLGRVGELEEAVKASEVWMRERKYLFQRFAEEFRRLGLNRLADEFGRSSRQMSDE